MLALSAACFSSSLHSEDIRAGTTQVITTPTWNMADVLPPEAGLTVENLSYGYTVEKEVADDMSVTIQNQNIAGTETLFSETDDWSGIPGNTIRKTVPVPSIPGASLGEGSIKVVGNGTVTDPSLVYSYKFDLCYTPLNDPSCPGYDDAMLEYLRGLGVLDASETLEDMYENELVQDVLDREVDKDEEDLKAEQKEESDKERARRIASEIEALGAGQVQMLSDLNNMTSFDSYYTVSISGGTYNDTVQLDTKSLSDNRRALSSLASDAKFDDMVRSQYTEN